jgi:hypothetical protein
MVVWLLLAAVGLVVAVTAVGVLYRRYQKGFADRRDVIGAALLVLLGITLVVVDELLVRGIAAIVFVMWLPVWLWWRRGPHQRV